MVNEFLSASAKASRVLATARVRHARARQRADARLATAQAIHATEIAAAREIEAQAWQRLMTVPGMTVTNAAQIGGISARGVHAWLSPRDAADRNSPCT